MTESITRIRGTGPSPFGIMLTLLKIRLSFLLFTSPPFATSIFLRLSCLCNSSLFLADLLQSFSNLCAQTRTFTYDAHTHFLILSLSLSLFLCVFFFLDLRLCIERDYLYLSLHDDGTFGISRPTFGLLCNQNNNNCFGTFDYSSIWVTADCPKLCVGIARSAAIRE